MLHGSNNYTTTAKTTDNKDKKRNQQEQKIKGCNNKNDKRSIMCNHLPNYLKNAVLPSTHTEIPSSSTKTGNQVLQERKYSNCISSLDFF